MKIIKAMKQLGLELRVHVSASGSALVLLTLNLLLVHFTQHVAASKRVMIDALVDTNNCSRDIMMKDHNEKFIVSVETNDCQRCKVETCALRFCNIKFIRDEILKNIFKICVETKYINLRGCSTRVKFTDETIYNRYVLICGLFSLAYKTSFCFARSDFMPIEFTSKNFCDVHGHLEVFLMPISESFYDLKSGKEGYETVKKVDTNSGTVFSSFDSGGEGFFCKLYISPSWKCVEEFCFVFSLADFPLHGAHLTIDTFDQKWEFNHTSRPSLEHNICTRNIGKHFMVKIFITSGDRKYENRWNHEFAFSFKFKEDLDGYSISSDSIEETEDSDSQGFRKKIIISVTVFWVALFICCYYACCKSKTANTNEANGSGDSGLGEHIVRSPYYERDPMGTNEESVPIYTQPTQATGINSAAANQQQPPDYGQVAASSSSAQYNTSHSGRPLASAQVLTEEERSDLPPAYDSLFPDRKDN